VEAILFDWDGTLVDSLGAFHVANAAVMNAFGLPFDEVVYRRHYVPDWREMYVRLGVPGDRLEEANALWEATFAAGSDLLVAFEGAADPIVKTIAAYDVQSIRSREADLEEVFLRFYRDEGST